MKMREEWQDDIYPAMLKRRLVRMRGTINRIQGFCEFFRRITVAVFI